ncbi:DUF3429 domain-containing protein [Roseibium hamelinense]|nr:DUF3429 domain-containing protein [Roseibium hamelinense]
MTSFPSSTGTRNSMPGGADATTIPRAALILGAAGFIPFALFCVAAIMAPPRYVLQAHFALNFYGAVILSFMGGVHWGLEMARQQHDANAPTFKALGISVLPSLAAFAALAMPVHYGAVALAVCFALLLAYDLYCAKAGLAPAWYPKLRIPLTIAVCLAVLLPSAV